MARPGYEKDFYLDCNGSHVGLRAMLLQKHEEGKRAVAYAASSLHKHDENWTATQLEAAACIWALVIFRPYIQGIRVIRRTDHPHLEYIKDRAMRLQGYQHIIQHRPGSTQKHVDCLCRAPVLPPPQEPMSLEIFLRRAALHVGTCQE